MPRRQRTITGIGVECAALGIGELGESWLADVGRERRMRYLKPLGNQGLPKINLTFDSAIPHYAQDGRVSLQLHERFAPGEEGRTRSAKFQRGCVATGRSRRVATKSGSRSPTGPHPIQLRPLAGRPPGRQ